MLVSIYDEDKPNVPVITTISAMAIIRNNSELLDAALSEIIKLPADKQLSQNPTGEIAYLLAAQAQLQGDTESTSGIYAHAVHADPTSTSARAQYENAIMEDSDEGMRDGSMFPTKMIHAMHRQPWKVDAAAWEAATT